jgi:hypothetical protein
MCNAARFVSTWQEWPMSSNMIAPVLALIAWTFVLWFWMYATRIPAIQRAGIDPARMKQKSELEVLPLAVKQIADNYNHLHEQPTVFYALAMCAHLIGASDALNIGLAWAYVALRVVHSLIQCTVNFIPVRFAVFAAASLVLLLLLIRTAIALIAAS